ncbi:MAG: MCE family protein [Bdellovibrionales bacterium]
MDSADGLFEGTQVHMAGLRVGQVTHVDINESNKIRVQMEVFEKFQPRIRENSQIMIVRPFVIGEKVIDILVGNNELKMVKAGSVLPVKSNTDIMDILSGRRLGPFLENTTSLFENFKILADAFADVERTAASFVCLTKLNR